MSTRFRITNSILWASAILAAAILHSPPFLTIVLLPMLAICSLITVDKSNGAACRVDQ